MKTIVYSTFVNESTGKHYFVAINKNVVHRIYSHFDDKDVFVYYRTTHDCVADAVAAIQKIESKRRENEYKYLGVQRPDNFTQPFTWYIGPQGTEV